MIGKCLIIRVLRRTVSRERDAYFPALLCRVSRMIPTTLNVWNQESTALSRASVRARDALRCAPSRRVLKLSRINDFHLSALLLSQPFLFVRVFGKRQNRDVHGISRNRIQNQDILQFLLVLVDSRASCTFRAPFSAPQAFHLLTQRSSYFRW